MKHTLFLLLLLCLFGCGKSTARHGSYSIGRDPTWFPIDIGKRDPNLNGFTDALVQEIAKTEHIPLKIIDTNWAMLFQDLEESDFAGVFTALSPNVITQEKFIFSDPFLLLGPVLVVPVHSKASSLEDLEGKIVAVNQFDESVLLVQKHPSIVIQLYDNKAMALEDLSKGRYDALLMPVLDAQALITQIYSEQLKIVTAPLNNKALRLVSLKHKNHALIRHFNRGLTKSFSSGSYNKLKKTFSLD